MAAVISDDVLCDASVANDAPVLIRAHGAPPIGWAVFMAGLLRTSELSQ